MPNTGAPANVWFPDDTAPVAPLEGLFSQQAVSVNLALALLGSPIYPDKATLDLNPGTTVGQHASVNADPTPLKNGDYVWGGSAWIYSTAGTAGITFAGIYSAGGYAPILSKAAGRIHADGAITSSSAGFAAGSTYTIGSIPAAFAPAVSMAFSCPANNAVTARVAISSAGSVQFAVPAGFTAPLDMWLGGISWPAK